MKEIKDDDGDGVDRGAKVQISFNAGVAPRIVAGYFMLCIFQRRKFLALVKPLHIQAMLPFNAAIVLL